MYRKGLAISLMLFAAGLIMVMFMVMEFSLTGTINRTSAIAGISGVITLASASYTIAAIVSAMRSLPPM